MSVPGGVCDFSHSLFLLELQPPPVIGHRSPFLPIILSFRIVGSRIFCSCVFVASLSSFRWLSQVLLASGFFVASAFLVGWPSGPASVPRRLRPGLSLFVLPSLPSNFSFVLVFLASPACTSPTANNLFPISFFLSFEKS